MCVFMGEINRKKFSTPIASPVLLPELQPDIGATWEQLSELSTNKHDNKAVHTIMDRLEATRATTFDNQKTCSCSVAGLVAAVNLLFLSLPLLPTAPFLMILVGVVVVVVVLVVDVGAARVQLTHMARHLRF